MHALKRHCLAHALAFVVTLAAAGVAADAVAAEPAATQASYRPPILAPLAAEPEEPLGRAPRRGSFAGNAVLDSPGGQLATTVAVFVFAMFLASLASRRS